MRFWDTSALLPLFVAEKESARARKWLRRDPTVVVWTLTRVELLSALARREREEPSSARALLRARRQVLAAWEEWSEIVALEPVRRQAERLVSVHPLRAADAVQLGAALVAADLDPAGLELVTFDERLATAAEKEGFSVLGV
ncbi:MAG TPA: type II toxin-antitoxin system VapC family toxin [Vicinamibacteria bacterium]|nr:type II toxin-antitoxin system VapC family toxin [Vicinamibacteria bacterium]